MQFPQYFPAYLGVPRAICVNTVVAIMGSESLIGPHDRIKNSDPMILDPMILDSTPHQTGSRAFNDIPCSYASVVAPALQNVVGQTSACVALSIRKVFSDNILQIIGWARKPVWPDGTCHANSSVDVFRLAHVAH